MSDGFLGRWSKRKLEVKQGKAVEAEPPVQPQPVVVVPPPQPSAEQEERVEAAAVGDEASLAAELPPSPEPPPLTLEDVKALTADSDFSRFVAPEVAPDVKNAAMKKLFADPRYNVMDMMDVYVDDYSQPDPIPKSMLRQLVSAKFLGLFDEEEKQEKAHAEAAAGLAAQQPRDVADNPTAQSVAQSEPAHPAVPEPPDHADPDLRLQQDHAAPGEDPGRGTA